METTTGHLCCALANGTLRRPVFLMLSPGAKTARRVGALIGLTFHPPREHWAAEVGLLAAYLDEKAAKMRDRGFTWQARVLNEAASKLRALFRAAPEVDGG